MLLNKTNKNVLAEEVEHFSSSASSAIGLRFRKRENCKNKAFIFHMKPESINIIDMFFVNFPIDLIFLNKEKKVIEIKKRLMPWKSYIPKTKPYFMIELVSGILHDDAINKGDLVLIE